MQYFKFSLSAGIGVLSLDRPQCANAYNQEMLRELSDFLHRNRHDEELGTLIISGGSSEHFCAGADLKELSQRTFQDGLDLLSRQVFKELASFPCPTIAAMHGAALGGGLELALACDIRVCTPDATLGFPELSRGLIPAAGGCTRATLIMGPALAKEMIIFGRRLSGLEAERFGIVSACAERQELLSLANRYAATAASQDRRANALAKATIAAVHNESQALEREGLSQAILYERIALRSTAPNE